MGLNLCLQTVDGKDHPLWDWGRHSGDRDVLGIIEAGCGLVSYPPPDQFEPWNDDRQWYRPADPNALDRCVWPTFNDKRWAQLVRILREEPGYWIYLSV